MILMWLIVALLAGGVLAWLSGRLSATLPRWIGLLALLADLGLAAAVLRRLPGTLAGTGADAWAIQYDQPWIPALSMRFHLAVDGFSLILIFLAILLGFTALIAAWKTIRERSGFFYFCLLWVLAGVLGVFMSLDLFLFYFAWELMLVPMYFIMAVWGDEKGGQAAAVKFFLFTQFSSLLMLLSILALFFIHGRLTGIYTFDYTRLIGTALSPAVGMVIMLGFFIAFAVKLPVILVHTWLPDAYTHTSAPGNVILAGLLSKTGAYGLLRFVLPLFPGSAATFAPFAMGLGAAAILYGAFLAFAQQDLKRLIAYTSLSHMGFVLLGVFAWNQLSLQGVIMIMLAHAVSISALFLLAGVVEERTGTRDLRHLGGLWSTTPRMAGALLLFAMAALGLPGLGNFVGEFLVLIGSYRVNIPITVIATLGLITSVIYAVWIVQRVLHGPNSGRWQLPDLDARETILVAGLAILIVWLGLYPQPVFRATAPAMHAVQQGTVIQAPDTQAPAGGQYLVNTAEQQAMDNAAESAEGDLPGGNS